MLGTAPGGHFRGERMFSHAPSSDGMRWQQVTEQQSSALDDFPTVSKPGRACFHPQNHSSLPQPTQASCCSVRKESRVSQL